MVFGQNHNTFARVIFKSGIYRIAIFQCWYTEFGLLNMDKVQEFLTASQVLLLFSIITDVFVFAALQGHPSD